VKQPIKLGVVGRSEFRDQDPDKEINARAMKMVKEIMFNAAPARYIVRFFKIF
jgi:hypothetical protein